MSLSRQLLVLIVLLLLLAFAGSFWIALGNTRDYVQRQSASHARDTAKALGLAASSALHDEDRATLIAMARALFDSGYYQKLRIVKQNGEALVDLRQPGDADVPDWFRHLWPLRPAEQAAPVMNGWRQAGRVVVQSHPGLAYRQLWNNARDLLLWFLGLAAVALVLGLLLLRALLRPLQSIEARAAAICEQDFGHIEERPRSRELARIVTAMNHATDRVRQMLADKDNLVAALREQVYQHPVTHLPNRRFFMNHLERELDSPETHASGALLLIQVAGFKGYNDRNGYVRGDELLRRVAAVLSPLAGEKMQLAHLNGADFILLAAGSGRDQSLQLAEQLRDAVGAELIDTLLDCRIGVAFYQCPELGRALLARADAALRKAAGDIERIGVSEDIAAEMLDGYTVAAWREELRHAVDDKRILFALQPVKRVREPDDAGTVLHLEALMRLRLHADGGIVTAGRFLPVAERFGLANALDVALLGAVLAWLGEQKAEARRRIAVNLSAQTLAMESEAGAIAALLDEYADLSGDFLSLEVNERLITRVPGHIAVLRGLADRFGVELGVDHVGTGFDSFAYINALRPAYMKIDGSFVRDVESNPDNQFYIRALGDICRGLGSLVVAECVESDEVMRQLTAFGVDALQGYQVGKPTLVV